MCKIMISKTYITVTFHASDNYVVVNEKRVINVIVKFCLSSSRGINPDRKTNESCLICEISNV